MNQEDFLNEDYEILIVAEGVFVKIQKYIGGVFYKHEIVPLIEVSDTELLLENVKVKLAKKGTMLKLTSEGCDKIIDLLLNNLPKQGESEKEESKEKVAGDEVGLQNKEPTQRCKFCGSENIIRHSKRHNKLGETQRYECKDCGKRFVSTKDEVRSYTKLKDCIPLGRTNTVTIYKEITDEIVKLFELGEKPDIKSIAEIIKGYYSQAKEKTLEVYAYQYLNYMRENNLIPTPKEEEKKEEEVVARPKIRAGSVEIEEPVTAEGAEIPSDVLNVWSKLPNTFRWADVKNVVAEVLGKRKLVSTTHHMVRLCKLHNLIRETESGFFENIGEMKGEK